MIHYHVATIPGALFIGSIALLNMGVVLFTGAISTAAFTTPSTYKKNKKENILKNKVTELAKLYLDFFFTYLYRLPKVIHDYIRMSIQCQPSYVFHSSIPVILFSLLNLFLFSCSPIYIFPLYACQT